MRRTLTLTAVVALVLVACGLVVPAMLAAAVGAGVACEG